jgi:hypothetical protein
MFGSCFTDDAIVELGPNPAQRGAAARDFLIAAFTEFEATHHLVGQINVLVDGHDASGVTYGCATHVVSRSSPASAWMVAGVYHDRFRRGQDGWRFAERRFERAWKESRSPHM